jgi:hypothetical protein
MSNRSAKLLLEVAQTFDLHAVRNPHAKLSGDTKVSTHPSLIDEVRTWAKGYREHMDKPRVPKLLPAHLRKAREALVAMDDVRAGLPPGLFLINVNKLGGIDGISEVPIEYY